MLVGCESEDSISDLAACSRDDGGLTLPDGFCATVVGDSLGPTRHLAVADNGDVYAALDGHGIVALRDTTGDYAADCVEYFGDAPGSGLRLHDGYLSAGADAMGRELFRRDVWRRGRAPLGRATGVERTELAVGTRWSAGTPTFVRLPRLATCGMNGAERFNCPLVVSRLTVCGVYSELVEVGSKEGVLPRCIAD
jgi:hypothetical protein